MQITCDKCKNEFILNDSLIKENGSTVRCTKCDHIFKAFPEGTAFDDDDDAIWEDAFDTSGIDPYIEMMEEEFLKEYDVTGQNNNDNFPIQNEPLLIASDNNKSELKDEVKSKEIIEKLNNLNKQHNKDNKEKGIDITPKKELFNNNEKDDSEGEIIEKNDSSDIFEENDSKFKNYEQDVFNQDLLVNIPDDERLLDEEISIESFKAESFQAETPIKNVRTRAFALLSGKGGTGKTSIAVSLGFVLAHCGFKTLLVDMDLFTHGMTFYALGDYPRKGLISLMDMFTEKHESSIINPIIVPDSFTCGNLFILPSITKKDIFSSRLCISSKYSNLRSFKNRLKEIIYNVNLKYPFDYIIFDTRGGTDFTNISTAIVAEEYLIITEADKPSWEVGKILIDSIEDVEKKEKFSSQRIGFIINKNVLPSYYIEGYLIREWGTPHIGTIPLDENTIRYFQENSVAVSKNIRSPFSKSIVKIIKALKFDQKWNDESSKKLKMLSRQNIIQAIISLIAR